MLVVGGWSLVVGGWWLVFVPTNKPPTTNHPITFPTSALGPPSAVRRSPCRASRARIRRGSSRAPGGAGSASRARGCPRSSPAYAHASARAPCRRGEDAAGPVGDVLFDDSRRGGPGPTHPRDVHCITSHGIGDWHAPHELLEGDDVRAADGVLEPIVLDRCRRLHDLDLLLLAEIIDDDLEHEPIELCLGERIRSLELDRVLR